MTLVAAPARVGNWLDASTPLSDDVLRDVAAGGYEGVARYAPLPGNPATYDLSLGELARVCATVRPDGTRLQCLLVQHCRLPEFNDLTRHAAELDASALTAHAKAVGYPAGCHVSPDLEGLKGKLGELWSANTAKVVSAWVATFAAAVRDAGYRTLLYHGYDVPLTSEQLYDLPLVDSYWRGLAGVEVAVRGCAVRQSYEVVVHGVRFDRNVLAPDKMGQVPVVAQLAT